MVAPEIPKVCRAAVVVNAGEDFSLDLIEDLPVPTPKEGELLLKMNATGICMSDVHFMKTSWGPMAEGCVASGHEGSGVVVAVGPGVDSKQWKVGDRGGVKAIFDTCHECQDCKIGREQYCDKAKTCGLHSNGSFAEYIISPARYTSHIPDGLDDTIAGPVLCSGLTIYKALKTSQAQPGDWVVIPGAGGGVGSLGIEYGKVLGLKILAIDTSDTKREMCLKKGATDFIDFKTCEDVTAEVHRITGGGAHAVIVTGGTASAYASGPPLLRKHGRLICVGLPAIGAATVGHDPFFVVFNDLHIESSFVGSLTDCDEALAIAAKGLVKPAVTVLPFKDFKKGLEMLMSGTVAGRVVIDYTL